MTAWTICKGILLAVGILFVGIPLAAGYLWLFVALVLVPVLGSAALNWRDRVEAELFERGLLPGSFG